MQRMLKSIVRANKVRRSWGDLHICWKLRVRLKGHYSDFIYFRISFLSIQPITPVLLIKYLK